MVTVTTLIGIAIILAVTDCAIYKARSDLQTLKIAYVFFRHGDQAPNQLYPNDPWLNRTDHVWPRGIGQITELGKNIDHQLGLWLRKRYNGFIKKEFDPKEFFIRSSAFDRNLQTAQLVTDAFYYPEIMNLNVSDFPRIPTPIHSAVKQDDKLLYVDIACPRIAVEIDKLQSIPEVQNYFKRNKDLYKFVEENSGANITKLEDFLDVYRALAGEIFYNLTIPQWAERNYDEIRTAALFWFQYFSYSDELKRLRVGPVFDLLTESMRNKSMGELPELKMLMFSYQGFHISAMLNTMGVFNGIEPPFSSALIFELHQIGKNYFVKVLYQNDTTFANPPLEMLLPGCSLELECPLSKFTDLLKDFIPKDWEKECHSVDPISKPYYTSDYTENWGETDVRMAVLQRND